MKRTKSATGLTLGFLASVISGGSVYGVDTSCLCWRHLRSLYTSCETYLHDKPFSLAKSRNIRYNATIIPTVGVNTYAFSVVSATFLDGAAWNTSETIQFQLRQYDERNRTGMLQTWHTLDLQSTIKSMQSNAKNRTYFPRVEPLECLLTYNNLLGNRSDLIMVSSAKPEANNSLLLYGVANADTWDVGYILCIPGNTFDCGRLAGLPLAQQQQAIQDWNIGGYKIDYCLSSQQSTASLCSVEYSFSILLSRFPCPTGLAPPFPCCSACSD